MATLYRNFPGRRELLEALYTDEVNAICKDAETVDGETPGAVLTAWLHRFSAFATSKRHIASELLEHTNRSNPLFDNNRARVIAAGRPLLAAAQRAHEVRDDLALEQVLDMVIAIATIHGDTRYLEPILQTALDGLPPDRCEARIGQSGTPFALDAGFTAELLAGQIVTPRFTDDDLPISTEVRRAARLLQHMARRATCVS
jgi:AcrR family transcriptional regulator